MKKCFGLIGFLCLFHFNVNAQLLNCRQPDANAHAREHNIDITHMLLDISFVPEKGLVKGNVTHTFTPLQKQVDSFVLDAVNINIKEVKMGGQTVKYKNTGKQLVVYPNTTLHWQKAFSVNIIYEATPKKGIYFIGFKDSTNRSRKQIWTQGQSTDNRHWIPGFDDVSDKLVTELKITTLADFNVLSNGEKIAEKKNKDGSKTWHYKMPNQHALYLTMIGAGNYAVRKSKSKSGVPINCWYYPDQPEKLEPTYRYTERIMDLLEAETGVPYPWNSYSQVPVQEFMYGAMENTTATVFGDFFYVDARGFLDRNYVGVNAHEMAHQWFGDLVTARSPEHHWLQESFATHYAKVVEHNIWGEDYYQWNKRGEANSALNASKTDNYPVAHTQAGSPRIYQKGSFVLDMLKYVIGRDEYNASVKHYLQMHKYGSVTTENFYSAFYETTGRNLDWFFDQWIYRGGEPHYKVNYTDVSSGGKRFTDIAIQQVQDVNELSGYFKMPVVVEVYYKDGSRQSKAEWVENQYHTIRIENDGNKDIDFVLFDPNSNILKQVTFEKSFEELSAQALKAANMIDRYDALVSLRSFPLDKKRNALLQAYAKETFHATKSEIISQIASDENEESRKLILNALADKDVKVRLAALESVKQIPAAHISAYEKMLQDSSYRIIEVALEKLSAQFPQNVQKYLELTKNETGMMKNIRIAWLKTALLYKAYDENTLAKYRAELTDYASNAFEFRTRVNAFTALQSLNYLDENFARSLMQASQSSNRRLAGPAMETINYFKQQSAYIGTWKNALNNGNWDSAQKEQLQKLLGL